MAVDRAENVVKDGVAWLEITPEWIAGLWGLQPLGAPRVVLGKIQVPISSGSVRVAPDTVVVGMVHQSFVPAQVLPKSAVPVEKGGTRGARMDT